MNEKEKHILPSFLCLCWRFAAFWSQFCFAKNALKAFRTVKIALYIFVGLRLFPHVLKEEQNLH
ncbi:MAG: hypothetical protein COX62_00715 [Deltaproteobacteria bacterium CG_4_10_14_0_2_um_filter_43_8]|nr:MAG: hypothetical protein COV43_03670 [Deltaproteobacteria bacterium CG11_big_fil_rev_8_21_14_0_20_42_23]PJA22124.1 MAG: hypothetical protein COX62_00715 [Deltaproteobacteria bacterium CG_4_10_14_0_2_um_filter_43_8]PJC64822.1 MAG: hypothetical protein CO021_02280 [Deltaproteobacteria bacterium CG_4_9_14_0_2_um_filter_42_21]